MTRMVWLNDGLVASDRAYIHITERGFTSGDGVFETLKVVNGQPFAITRHLNRLANSATKLRIECPDDDKLRAAIAEVISANADIVDLARMRITLTAPVGTGMSRGEGVGTFLVTLTPAIDHGDAASVITVQWPHNERALLSGAKSTSYADAMAILDYAKSHDADEALIPDTAGRLCEGATCNVVIEHDGQLVTPTLATGCLAGVTRALALEWGLVVEHDVAIEATQQATEVLISSSTRELLPVRSVDGRVLAAPGPLGSAAIAEFRQRAADNLDP